MNLFEKTIVVIISFMLGGILFSFSPINQNDLGGRTSSEAQPLNGIPNVDHSSDGPKTKTFNAGATVTAMQLLYLATDGEWAVADASATSTSGGQLSIGLEAGTDGNALEVALSGSFVRDDSWNWGIGETIYASETAGEVTTTTPVTSGAVVRPIGHSVTADVIWFKPASTVITLS